MIGGHNDLFPHPRAGEGKRVRRKEREKENGRHFHGNDRRRPAQIVQASEKLSAWDRAGATEDTKVFKTTQFKDLEDT